MRAFFPLIALALLAGCGYKGPLYLPKPEAQKPAPAAQPGEKRPPPGEAQPPASADERR
ncbi:MAG TPA: lipoprotein [Burkholderiales bacterium]|nr:lipoprotein [Burkholderiales bacterium]